MDWRVFLVLFLVGLGVSVLLIVMQVSLLARRGLRQTVRDLWRTYFGKTPTTQDDDEDFPARWQ